MCVSGGASSVCFDRAEGWESVDVGGGLPQPTLRGSHSGFAISKLRCRLRLCLHGVVHDTPSPMAGLRLASPSAMAAGVAVVGLFCGFFCGAAGGFFCGGSAC